MHKLLAVIFDVDGVLLDSLASHLQICKDKNVEFKLGLSIPGVNEFREMVRQGVKISPMKYFFEAVGFPRVYAEQANEQYKETFMRDYAPKPFPQVDKMLPGLFSAGLKLGIVTSNVRANVDSALGSNMQYFLPEVIFTKEDSNSASKSDQLRLAAKQLELEMADIIYVGDQPADWKAAKEAGTGFLGVTYGWGISPDDEEFPTVNSVECIEKYILEMREC